MRSGQWPLIRVGMSGRTDVLYWNPKRVVVVSGITEVGQGPAAYRSCTYHHRATYPRWCGSRYVCVSETVEGCREFNQPHINQARTLVNPPLGQPMVIVGSVAHNKMCL
jgi:hypothetical protein